MAQTLRSPVSDGVTTLYDVNFDLGYLEQEHVYVYTGDHNSYATQLAYSWINSTQIQLDAPELIGVVINIRRIVPRNELTNDYEDGAILKEANLDDSFKQTLMIQEEVSDGWLNAITGEWNFVSDVNMNGFDIKDAGSIEGTSITINGVSLEEEVLRAEDAADAAVVSAGEAVVSASAALDSEVAAALILVDFETKYLGPFGTPPTLDNEGQPLLVGALYWDTNVVARMKTWNGAAWENAITGTAGALDAGSGVGELTVNSATVAGHIRAGNTQLWDGRAEPVNELHVNDDVTSVTWESVGATASGADNIWTAMDVLPANATVLLVDLRMYGATSGAGPGDLRLFCSDGDDPSPDTADANVIGELGVRILAANGTHTHISRVAIPLGATNKDFNVLWITTSLVAEDIDMFYRGFMTN